MKDLKYRDILQNETSITPLRLQMAMERVILETPVDTGVADFHATFLMSKQWTVRRYLFRYRNNLE